MRNLAILFACANGLICADFLARQKIAFEKIAKNSIFFFERLTSFFFFDIIFSLLVSFV